MSISNKKNILFYIHMYFMKKWITRAIYNFLASSNCYLQRSKFSMENGTMEGKKQTLSSFHIEIEDEAALHLHGLVVGSRRGRKIESKIAQGSSRINTVLYFGINFRSRNIVYVCFTKNLE
ncbi:hypothetical protein ACJX0J_037945 [Zea mays]